MSFSLWRIIHKSTSGLILILGIVHTCLTAVNYDNWNYEALWFAGTGLSLIVLGLINWSHVGLAPCTLPTARVVLVINIIYAIFGVAAVLAVPEPQAYILAAAFWLQTIAGFFTLRPTNTTA